MRLGTWGYTIDSAEFKSNISRIRVWNEKVCELHKVSTAKVRVGDSILLQYLQPEAAKVIARAIIENPKIRQVHILTQPWNLNDLKEPMYSKLLELDNIAQHAFLSVFEASNAKTEIFWRGIPIRTRQDTSRDVTPVPETTPAISEVVDHMERISLPPPVPMVPPPQTIHRPTYDQLADQVVNLKAEIHRVTIENENLKIQLHDAVSRMNRFVNGNAIN